MTTDTKDTKSPVLEKEPIEQVAEPDYTDKERDYLKGLKTFMEKARNARDAEHDEFDGMPYETYYQLNERFANTYIQPKQNKEDTNFQSGTIRQKLFALLSSLVNLNLSGDITAYDKEGLQIQGLGDAMEDIVLKTKELDLDDEKKYLRQYELLKHGTVFVEELWDEKTKVQKTTKGKFKGKLNDVKWTPRIKKAFARPTRNIVPGPNVYLGDITKYDISEQPYVFTVEQRPYQEAKRIFGQWDRWKYVPRTLQKVDGNDQSSVSGINWRVWTMEEDMVEIVRYQDKWNNEFAVVLNGVLMTPVGLPLPWGYEDYNIAQQNLEPIHAKFAYGKSLVARIRNKVALLDEFMRLAILKTQKSYMPPYVNISGRILSNRVLMPGKISYGIQPGTLVPINEKEAQGVTQAEMAMLQEIQTSIDSETTSPTFQGQKTKGDTTATEIIELQRQARMVLGLTIFATSMLEWKLEWLRLKNILANWFEPEDEVVDEARKVLKETFRQVSVDRNIEGEGMGRRIVVPSKEIPSGRTIMQTEDALSKEQGIPVRLIFVDPEQVTKANLIWQIVIVPKEKKSSEVNKLMFRAFMQDVIPLNPNISYLQERMASVWEENPQKLFAPNPVQPGEVPGQPGQPGQTPPAQGNGGGVGMDTRVKLPTAEKAMGRQIRTQMGVNA